MINVHCMNAIAKVGTDQFGPGYELCDRLEAADVIMVRSAQLHEVEFPDNLLAIARAGAGVNNIPLERCADEGIVVFNTPGANANAVKESVVAGMLLACRDLIGGIDWVHENADDPEVGKKAEKAKNQFAGSELAGKTMGVIGLGAIGAMVANTARSLGMRVLGYDPYLSLRSAWSLDRHVKHVTNLDDILTTSDFITIHVPATDATKGMIGRTQIERMKDGVVFLNFARDALVDEQAMAEALDDGKVRRYVTDFANPVTANMPRAIVMPHLGASTAEAEDNCAVMAANELKDYVENGNITNSVNFPEVDFGPLVQGSRLCVFHENIPAMIGQITSVVSEAGVNIENMSDKSRGEHAYLLLDSFGDIPDEVATKVAGIHSVTRVRIIRK